MTDFYFKFTTETEAHAQISAAFNAAGYGDQLQFEADGTTIRRSFARPNFSICCYPAVSRPNPDYDPAQEAGPANRPFLPEPGYFVFVRAIGPIADLVAAVAPANQNRDLEGNPARWSEAYTPFPGF